jgi:hypothetical protein
MSEQTLTRPEDGAVPAEHQALADQVRQLGDAVTTLAGQGHAQSLLRVMRRPGWTSRQEAQLVSAMVGHLHEQVGALQRGHDALLSAADGIGRP